MIVGIVQITSTTDGIFLQGHIPCFFFEKRVYVGFRHDYKTHQANKAQLFQDGMAEEGH